MKTIRIGLSPCPNDTFMFYPLLHNRIDTAGYCFEPCFADVESLNQKAFKGEFDITKLSFHAWLLNRDKYTLLDAGAALGFGCGPLLIAKNNLSNGDLMNVTVAHPGLYTTAHLLLKLYFPIAVNKIEMLFSSIEDAILTGKADAGVIIHENRFTYEKRGLIKICDLGKRWENETQAPIPLGGIFIKQNQDPEFQKLMNRLIKSSIVYARQHEEETMKFVKKHAWEMDEHVMKQHIDLYVNEYSTGLGTKGRKAIELLAQKFLLIQAEKEKQTEKN